MEGLKISRRPNPTLGEEVHETKLPSGLRVFFLPKPGFRKKYACYAAHYGSVDNEIVTPAGEVVRVPDGIAHFLEHTLFETEDGNASDLLAALGAYSNAATSFTTTGYVLAAADRFYECLALLIRFVETPAFRADKVEKEKRIIAEEIRGYDDDPDWVAYMGLLGALFARHPIRIDIAGTVESIQQIDVAALDLCYRTFYHPENMALFVVGDLDPAEVFGFVAAHSRREAPVAGRPSRRYPDEPEEPAQREAARVMDVALPKLLIGFKEVGVPLGGEEYVRRELTGALGVEILFGRSGRLYRELYEEGLILDDFSAEYAAGAGIGFAVVGGDAPDPDRLRKRIEERLGALLAEGVDEAEFERKKRRFLGGFIRRFNSLEYIAGHYTYYKFHDYDLFDLVDLAGRIHREEVVARVRSLLSLERSAAFTVKPRSG